MIEIGKVKTLQVRTKGADGVFRLRRSPDGTPETKSVSADVWRETRNTLGGQHGRDKRRKLVVGLVSIDQLVLYPKGTRQEVRVNLVDVYTWALRSRALRAQLERARERKDKLKLARERRSIASADRRLRQNLKKLKNEQP